MIKWFVSLFAKQTGPLDNVTPRAQTLLVLSRRQADRLRQSYVGTEHLLLGLLELKEGIAYAALQHLKIDIAALQQTVDAEAKIGKAKEIRPTIPYTPMVAKVLKNGAVEATLLGHDYLGTEHVLLGILRGRCGIAGSVLGRCGLKLEATRDAVRAVLAAK